MADIAIAVFIALLTLASGYIGFRLSVHAPQTQTEKRRYKLAFVLMGVTPLPLIGFQAYRSFTSSQDLKALLEKQGQDIAEIKEGEKRPIQVNVPPITFPQQPTRKQDARAAKKLDLKLKATQLSAEILTYLSERRRSGLEGFRLGEVMSLHKGLTAEEFKERWSREEKRHNDFRDETLSLYRRAFEDRAIALLRNMAVNDIDAQRAWYKPNSPETIERFALDLAAVARDIN